jgi:hypothetical protein
LWKQTPPAHSPSVVQNVPNGFSADAEADASGETTEDGDGFVSCGEGPPQREQLAAPNPNASEMTT